MLLCAISDTLNLKTGILTAIHLLLVEWLYLSSWLNCQRLISKKMEEVRFTCEQEAFGDTSYPLNSDLNKSGRML
jgi:hypothetical protein